MATHSVLHGVNTPSITNVIPIKSPSSPQTITQLEISLILELRRRADVLQQQIDEAEKSIRARLETGSEVEDGVFHAYIKTTERRSVAWKAVVERELGEDYATRVLAATKPDKFSTLVVSV